MIKIAKIAAHGNFLGNLFNLGNPSSDDNSGSYTLRFPLTRECMSSRKRGTLWAVGRWRRRGRFRWRLWIPAYAGVSVFKVNHFALSVVPKVAAADIFRQEPKEPPQLSLGKGFHLPCVLSLDGGSEDADAGASPGAGSASPTASSKDAADVSV